MKRYYSASTHNSVGSKIKVSTVSLRLTVQVTRSEAQMEDEEQLEATSLGFHLEEPRKSEMVSCACQ